MKLNKKTFNGVALSMFLSAGIWGLLGFAWKPFFIIAVAACFLSFLFLFLGAQSYEDN
jgi:hypothetical protein